jgi:hypothetical protein
MIGSNKIIRKTLYCVFYDLENLFWMSQCANSSKSRLNRAFNFPSTPIDQCVIHINSRE